MCRFLAAASGGQILVEKETAATVAQRWAIDEEPMMDSLATMYKSQHSAVQHGSAQKLAIHPAAVAFARGSSSYFRSSSNNVLRASQPHFGDGTSQTRIGPSTAVAATATQAHDLIAFQPTPHPPSPPSPIHRVSAAGGGISPVRRSQSHVEADPLARISISSTAGSQSRYERGAAGGMETICGDACAMPLYRCMVSHSNDVSLSCFA